MPNRRWSDEQLVEAVARSHTMAEVTRLLGLRSGHYEWLRKHIARLGLDSSHLRSEGTASRRLGGWTDEELAVVVAESRSYAEVMRQLGYNPSGGVHRWLSGVIRSLGLSTEHFAGKMHNQGRRFPGRGQPLDEILVRGSTYPSARLRARLIAGGRLEGLCAECGLTAWRDQEFPLMLDHINGDHLDNRIENLRILCPNCHSLTPTWCARNRKPA